MDREMREMEDAYSQWREGELKHAHIMSVHSILDTLGDSEQDKKEQEYQSLRMKYSPAYFSGHVDYRGERLTFDVKKYERVMKMLGVLGVIGLCS